MGERSVRIRKAVGSNPIISITSFRNLLRIRRFRFFIQRFHDRMAAADHKKVPFFFRWAAGSAPGGLILFALFLLRAFSVMRRSTIGRHLRANQEKERAAFGGPDQRRGYIENQNDLGGYVYGSSPMAKAGCGIIAP